jgi:hypothetical protein
MLLSSHKKAFSDDSMLKDNMLQILKMLRPQILTNPKCVLTKSVPSLVTLPVLCAPIHLGWAKAGQMAR